MVASSPVSPKRLFTLAAASSIFVNESTALLPKSLILSLTPDSFSVASTKFPSEIFFDISSSFSPVDSVALSTFDNPVSASLVPFSISESAVVLSLIDFSSLFMYALVSFNATFSFDTVSACLLNAFSAFAVSAEDFPVFSVAF